MAKVIYPDLASAMPKWDPVYLPDCPFMVHSPQNYTNFSTVALLPSAKKQYFLMNSWIVASTCFKEVLTISQVLHFACPIF